MQAGWCTGGQAVDAVDAPQLLDVRLKALRPLRNGALSLPAWRLPSSATTTAAPPPIGLHPCLLPRRRRGGGAEAQLRGFFWASAPSCEFVMVTSQGMLLFTLQQPGGQGLTLQSTLALPGLQWFSYNHPTRIAMAACGSTGARLQAVQFTREGVVRLRLLDLNPPWGSPPKPVPPQPAAAVAPAPGQQLASGHSGSLTFPPAGQPPPQPPLLVPPAAVSVVRLCGRVYIAYHDRGRRVLQVGGYRCGGSSLKLLEAGLGLLVGRCGCCCVNPPWVTHTQDPTPGSSLGGASIPGGPAGVQRPRASGTVKWAPPGATRAGTLRAPLLGPVYCLAWAQGAVKEHSS